MSLGDMMVQRIMGNIGFCTYKPAEGWLVWFVDAVPHAEPRQFQSSLLPEPLRILKALLDQFHDLCRGKIHLTQESRLANALISFVMIIS